MNVGFFEFNQGPWHLGVAFEIAQEEIAYGNKIFFNFLAHDVAENKRNKYVPNFHALNKYLYPEYKIANTLHKKYKNNFIFNDTLTKKHDKKLFSDQLIKDARYAARMDLIDDIKGNLNDDSEFQNIIEKKIHAYCNTYVASLKFIVDNQITKIFTYNGRFLHERAVWDASKIAGIECNFHEKVDSIRGNTYTIFKIGVHSPEERSQKMNNFWEESPMSVSNKIDIANDWLLKRQKGVTQKFTKMQLSNYSPKFDGKKSVLFLHSSDDEIVSSGLNYPTKWGDQQSTIIMLNRVVESMNDLNLVIRVHPNLLSKNSSEQFKWLQFFKDMNCTVIEPNSKYDTYQLIKDALCVVTYGSTAGIEATLLKKPSILVGPALHERLNATINVNGESDLRELLDKIIHNKININDNLYQAYKYAFWHSQAGTRFRYNKIVGNIESQDPLLEVCGIKLTYHFLYKLMYKLQNKFYPSRLFH